MQSRDFYHEGILMIRLDFVPIVSSGDITDKVTVRPDKLDVAPAGVSFKNKWSVSGDSGVANVRYSRNGESPGDFWQIWRRSRIFDGILRRSRMRLGRGWSPDRRMDRGTRSGRYRGLLAIEASN